MFSVILLCALAAACVPATPDARIERNRARFDALPTEHQEYARQGRVVRGMSMDAVHFAWGTPDAILSGSRKGRDSTRWDYNYLRPVFYDGYAYAGYGRGFGAYPYLVPAPYGPVGYIPYRTATVWFVDGLVDEWERLE